MEFDDELKLDKYYADLFFPPKNPRENEECSKFFYRWGFFAAGFIMNAQFRNKFGLGRPPLAGVQLSLLCGVIGFGIGEGVRRTIIYYNDYHMSRTLHYVVLHPELFPPPKRVKFADYFDKWDPAR